MTKSIYCTHAGGEHPQTDSVHTMLNIHSAVKFLKHHLGPLTKGYTSEPLKTNILLLPYR